MVSFREINALSRDELIGRYDEIAGSTQPGLSFYRDEIVRRDTAAQNQRIERMTSQIRWLTVTITVLTLANVVAVVLALAP